MELQSLNYTELASIVLALCIFTTLLLSLIIYLMNRVKQIQHDFIKEDEYALKQLIVVDKELTKNVNKHNLLQLELINELEKKIANLEKSLIKPKFNIGDKVKHVAVDGIGGVVTHHSVNEHNRFSYVIKGKNYFGRGPKEYTLEEFNLKLA